MNQRLDKLISEGLGISRRDAKKLISKGSVQIDGTVCKDPRQKTRPRNMTVDGKALQHEEFVYIMLNKPAGVVSASRDKNDITVVDLVKKDFPRRELFPAGRLDKTSTGLVLITDDGKFAHDILSPKKHVPKTYFVTVDKPVDEFVVKEFEKGVTLADGSVMKSAQIYPIGDGLSARIILHQGVYHQIKRMLGVYGIGVNSLHRTAIGDLELPENLMPGEYVKLDSRQLLKIVNHHLTKN